MIPCSICNNSGRATLYLRADGWGGCIRVNPKLHFATCAKIAPKDAIAQLEKMTGREIDAWDTMRVAQNDGQQGRLL